MLLEDSFYVEAAFTFLVEATVPTNSDSTWTCSKDPCFFPALLKSISNTYSKGATITAGTKTMELVIWDAYVASADTVGGEENDQRGSA